MEIWRYFGSGTWTNMGSATGWEGRGAFEIFMLNLRDINKFYYYRGLAPGASGLNNHMHAE